MFDLALMAVRTMGGEKTASGGRVVNCPFRLAGSVSVEQCGVCAWGRVLDKPRGGRVHRVACGIAER